jgi:WD40 repeat protein
MVGDGYAPAPEDITRDEAGEAVISPVGPMMSDVLFSPDGARILSLAYGVEAPDEANLKLWETATCRELAKIAAGVKHITDCAFSPDGTRLAVASDDGVVRLFDASTGAELLTLAGHDDRVFACSFSPDGQWIISVSADATVKLWESDSGAEVCTYSPGSGQLDARWYPDGTRLAVSTDQGLHVVRLENSEAGPIVANAWRSHTDHTIAVGCVFCLTWSEVPRSALGDEWRCQKCETLFRLNSRPIEGNWRSVASAWAVVEE